MAIKFDSHLLWLKPYTDAIADLVDISRLKEVKLSTYSRKKLPAYHGWCERSGNNKSYRILVRTSEKSPKRWPMTPVCQEQVLSTYAHECSHLSVFADYVVERFALEAQIYLRFAEVLKARGYEQVLNKI